MPFIPILCIWNCVATVGKAFFSALPSVTHFFWRKFSMPQFYKEMLEKYSFHSLRDLARSMGVKAPSQLKKDELIFAILDIQNNKTEPVSTNKGRPPSANIEMVLSSLKREELEKLLDNLYEDFKKKLFNFLKEKP